MNRAVFLDRDGTINRDLGDICSPDQLIFIPGAFEALRLLQKQFLLFVITNQSGIGKGVFNKSEYRLFNMHFQMVLKTNGVVFEKVYCCPHKKEDGCLCRKPGTFFLKQAEKEFDIDLTRSYVVGDHPHDIETAQRAGAGSIYLLTGHGGRHKHELKSLPPPDFIAQDVYEAALWISKRQSLTALDGVC